MTLAVLDTAVEDIITALDDTGMLDTTIVLFASDNGGCYNSGGKNGPLRGTKATLFEGGTKVDSFIYSPLLSSSLAGTTYSGMFHVSDWFPTILDFAGISYTAADGYSLDGVSHFEAFGVDESPRSYLLYNSYHNINGVSYSRFVNQSFAIRNSQ